MDFDTLARPRSRRGVHSVRPGSGSRLQCGAYARAGQPGLGVGRGRSALSGARDLAYSNEDLHQQDALLRGVQAALAQLVEESRDLSPVLLVRAPLRFEGKLFNCAVVVYRGRARCRGRRLAGRAPA
jgi:hypothetical protein